MGDGVAADASRNVVAETPSADDWDRPAERQGPRVLASRIGRMPTGRRLPPEPPNSGKLGTLMPFRGDPLGTLRASADACGDVVSLRLGPPRACLHAVLVRDPSSVAHVLRVHQRRYAKSFTNLPARAIFGRGLLTDDGPSWEFQHRLVRPIFHRQRLEPLVEATNRSCDRLIERLRDRAETREPIDVLAEMAHASLEVLSRSVFGTDFEQEDVEAIWRAFPVVSRGAWRRTVSLSAWMLPGVARGVPTPDNTEFNRNLQSIEGIVDKLLARRREGDAEGDDLLALLLAARDDEGRQLDRRLIRDELMTFLVAGHETTASALAWALYELARHPDARAAVEAEADAIGVADGVGLAQVGELARARASLEEALRLYPPAWSIVRDAVVDDTINGYDIPAGTVLITCPFVTQRDPAYWESPDEYRPERFLSEDAAQRPAFAYFPFGGGSRRCIGERFALTQATMMVSRVSEAVRLALEDPTPIAPLPAVTLRPARPILARVLPRASAQ